MMKTKQRQKGDGLVGMLIAAVVFAVGIAAIMQLQGGFFRTTSATNALTIATNVGEDTIETLRGFQAPGSSEEGKGFETIVNNAGVGIASGTVSQNNIDFNRSWDVTNYYSEADGDLTTTDTGNIVQKKVVVTVAWTDIDGTARTVLLDTVISKINATSAAGAVGSNVGGTGSKPDIPYTPSNIAEVVPIGVGTDSIRETLVPTAQSSNQGYSSTEFTAYTYDTSGSNILLRQEDFQTIACDCTFDGTGDAYGPSYPKWNTGEKTYIDEEGVLISKVKGKETNQSHIYCDICCRDHHDSASVSQLYDPYRSSDDFDSGDHKHYNGTSVVTSGQYLESCRLKRVNGYWRVYQDWHMVELTVLPLSDLTNSATRLKYQNYVIDVIDEHLDESKVSGETLTTSPTIDSSLNHSVSNNYVALSLDGTSQQLTARGIYLDFMYDSDDNPHLTQVKALKSGSGDYLLHVPFYEVDVTKLSSWSSKDTSKVSVGKENSSLDQGVVQAEANTPGEEVEAIIKYSNSGVVLLNSAVDYNATVNADDETRADSVIVSVGVVGSSTTTTSTTSTSTTSTTSTLVAATTTTTLGGCGTTISGKTAAQSQTPFLVINSGSPISCGTSGANKKFTCPFIEDILLGSIVTITSNTETLIVDPFCGNPSVEFLGL